MAGRILIVDDVATNRIVMKVKLNAARYDVVTAGSGQEALDVARAGGIDIIIMDMMMPNLTGAETCARLRADPATATVPVILVTASDDTDARMEGLSAGADDFLSKPVDEIALLARVRSLLRTREEERTYEEHGGALLGMGFAEAGGQTPFEGQSPAPADGQIALIADSTSNWLLRQRDRLRPLFRERVAVMGRDAALALDRESAPDLFLIDADFGAPNAGLRLLSELRSRNATRHAALIVILPAGDSERAATALDLGASDVAYQPFPVDEIAMRIRTQLSRKKRADRMRDTLETGLRLAVIDPLTGLHNRRYGLHHLDRVATRCRAQGIRAGIILMDLDHFKAVNDTHGHLVGDKVLSLAAKALKDNLRNEDLVCRIGGEEFLAVLPDSDIEKVRAVAERLRGAVEALDVRLEDGGPLTVTMSLGVAMLSDREDAPAHALAVVDRALYAAKDAGRNRVELAESFD
ncbi:diguanylate cyclase response regulator [Jannaschia pagri]|uniref:diguanylate cyclase n=1 Tax=Jannaschia pagri TaxID=2829797 RepID=A0ABQ4NJC3_9RHOB|nr:MULTISPECIES: diguanylate cyclase [unclassified Jannaschia]GIT90681.1 diguanylate cyclase response regulator [Jannaschia sp. AI_61]GIT94513.1 diguanylate cyclase response regulator [Jannaschia sp. AI_62]